MKHFKEKFMFIDDSQLPKENHERYKKKLSIMWGSIQQTKQTFYHGNFIDEKFRLLLNTS